MISIKHNNDGLTLFELLVSILVGSVVISILMSVLVMGISAKARADYNNRLFSDSYYIGEFIKRKAVDLGTQQIDIIEDGVNNTTTIRLTHLYDVSLVGTTLTRVDNVIEYDFVFDRNNNTLTFYNELDVPTVIHSSNTIITDGTSFTLTEITADNCNFTTVSCSAYVLTLDLELTATFNGSELEPKKYKTTLII